MAGHRADSRPIEAAEPLSAPVLRLLDLSTPGPGQAWPLDLLAAPAGRRLMACGVAMAVLY